MKITKRQLRRIVRNQILKEAYPIGGDTPSNAWQRFEDAVHEAAAELIDAGMEADGVMRAMQDSIQETIDAMEAEWDAGWDEADQDNANQEYIAQHGDPYGE